MYSYTYVNDEVNTFYERLYRVWYYGNVKMA